MTKSNFRNLHDDFLLLPNAARKLTTVIVQTGPYRLSRNPIYLAFSLFQLGIAIWSNSLWLLVTLVGAVGSCTTSSYLGRSSIWNEDSAPSIRITSSPCGVGCKHPTAGLGRHIKDRLLSRTPWCVLRLLINFYTRPTAPQL
jgi:hypothetical protein